MDGKQSLPTEADGDRDALEQPGQIHQTFDLCEARAGEDEQDREDATANSRVERPPALAPPGEPAAEHEAGRCQRHEAEEREEVVEGTVPAVTGQPVRGPGRVATHGISDEDPRAEQTDRPYSDQQRSPGRALP